MEAERDMKSVGFERGGWCATTVGFLAGDFWANWGEESKRRGGEGGQTAAA